MCFIKRLTVFMLLICFTAISVSAHADNAEQADIIKWMDFDVPVKVMQTALKYDIESYYESVPLDWVELLAYAASKNWGTIKNEAKACKDIDQAVSKLRAGESMSDITQGMKSYSYFYKTYSAVLSGFVGEYEVVKKTDSGDEFTERKYGLKVFSPIAKGYSFSHYDDFGVARTYGYKRKHLGNDLMGSTGTPIVAIEDGYIEAMGWNQFGGWRIGIRSHDKKRYYYYAHLKKDHPYSSLLKEGMDVKAGDVIGYLGMTGYSSTENTNNINIPHLHFGMQIIFDESQKDGTNQIWIDVYNIVELLNKNRMGVFRNNETNEAERTLHINSIYNE